MEEAHLNLSENTLEVLSWIVEAVDDWSARPFPADSGIDVTRERLRGLAADFARFIDMSEYDGLDLRDAACELNENNGIATLLSLPILNLFDPTD